MVRRLTLTLTYTFTFLIGFMHNQDRVLGRLEQVPLYPVLRDDIIHRVSEKNIHSYYWR